MEPVTIYTDGSCYPNPGPGGYGAVVLRNGSKHDISGGYRKTTNNRMEIMACLVALHQLGIERHQVTLYSDSQYVVKGVDRAYGWRAMGWANREGPVKNIDLWKLVLAFDSRHEINWQWIKGHAGNEYNEICDKLALDGRKNMPVGIDRGFEDIAR